MEIDQENGDNTRKRSSNVRKQRYRGLLKNLEGLRENEDIGINTVKEVGVVLKEVQAIDNQCDFENRVEYADETLLQHVVLSTSSGILIKCLENANIFISTYESADFASKLLNGLNDSNSFKPSDWLNILEDARALVPSLKNFSFLYGTFDPTHIPEPKQRKERNKRLPQERVQKVQLERVHNLQKEEEGIEDTVKFLGNILAAEYENNNNDPLLYMDFVIDSTSYGATIENIFYTSFLIRDGKAKLDLENNIPTIQPMRSRDLKAFRQSGGENNQMITSLTMDDWEVLRIKDGYIQTHKNLLKSKK
ncbi:hypothetical protein RN001_000838 [Aquatica leii]|uniref:Non-structural maintenance of chromosomes element 4 n=1 Tax=Aquatica leii TaxID=1421715 RepID=A0AAN7SJB7_9COLE|nr:hypothetical protein RN001_000838 [Aquatica leii]